MYNIRYSQISNPSEWDRSRVVEEEEDSLVLPLILDSWMAAVNAVAVRMFLAPLSNSNETPIKCKPSLFLYSSRSFSCVRIATLADAGSRGARSPAVASKATDDVDVFPVHIGESKGQQIVIASNSINWGEEEEGRFDQPGPSTIQIGGFAFESGGCGGGGTGFPSSSSSSASPIEGEDEDKLFNRAINAAIVLAAGTFSITKLLTIDMDYWHGWTLYEILRYVPQHNWTAYEEALKTNPVLAKMMISGVVYSIGDWIAQCYAGKPLFDFDRARMFRSGLTGFALHGSLSHYYYEFCESLFPFQDWWVVPAKVIFDQTAWSATWNSIYYVVLGFLRFESPANIFSELKATFLPMLTAGWKLWPFAHLITYGVIPIEQRLLWVDCVELIWVMILSTYSNEKSEARNFEVELELSECFRSAAPEDMRK